METAAPGTTYLSPRNAELSAEASCSGLECLLPLLVEQLFMLFWLGVLGLVVVATLVYLPKARDVCSEEWKRTKAELDALDRFISRISTIEVGQDTKAAMPVAGGSLAVSASQPTEHVVSMEEIRDSYRNTVMDVPHFVEEYDETLREHMAAEFSEELAGAVSEGDIITPQVQQALVEQAKHARTEREALLVALDREAEALSDAVGTLSDIQRTVDRFNGPDLTRKSFDELSDAWHKLDRLSNRRQDLIEGRQRSLHEGVQLGRRIENASHFYDYLYHPLDVTYPILSDGVRLANQIGEARQRVLDSITRRV